MKTRKWLASGVFIALFAACTDAQQELEQARERLTEVQNEGIKKVEEAQMQAAKDVNRVKEDVSEEIEEAREELSKAQERAARLDARREDGSSSGATTSAGLVDRSEKYTPEFCENLAQAKTVSVEDKDAYEACSNLKKRR